MVICMKKKRLYIILSVLLLSLVVTFVDTFVKPNYFYKIIVKAISFLLIPVFYFVLNKEEINDFKKLFIPKKKMILKLIVLAFLIYFGIVGGYFLTRNIIDYSNVSTNLEKSMGIDSSNLIYVTLYISLMNSFLEEFFFRGFGFITLKKYVDKRFAYLFSPLLFAVYHIGMLIGSFHVGMIFLLMLGLIFGGCIFNYLNEKSENIYASWFVHMFANFGINTVGFILFGIL